MSPIKTNDHAEASFERIDSNNTRSDKFTEAYRNGREQSNYLARAQICISMYNKERERGKEESLCVHRDSSTLTVADRWIDALINSLHIDYADYYRKYVSSTSRDANSS